jgi:hypothetical protein
MATGPAHIRSPDVLTRFRRRFIAFFEKAQSALELVTGDLSSVRDWIEREQLPGWKKELRRREDMVKLTWREYFNARYGDRRMGKPSSVDERKAYELAKRRKEEAEAKIAQIERWRVGLDQQAEKLMPAIKKLTSLLDQLTPLAIARLDFMLDRLEEYLMPASGGTAGRDAATKKEGGDAPDQPA